MRSLTAKDRRNKKFKAYDHGPVTAVMFDPQTTRPHCWKNIFVDTMVDTVEFSKGKNMLCYGFWIIGIPIAS